MISWTYKSVESDGERWSSGWVNRQQSKERLVREGESKSIGWLKQELLFKEKSVRVLLERWSTGWLNLAPRERFWEKEADCPQDG